MSIKVIIEYNSDFILKYSTTIAIETNEPLMGNSKKVYN